MKVVNDIIINALYIDKVWSGKEYLATLEDQVLTKKVFSDKNRIHVTFKDGENNYHVREIREFNERFFYYACDQTEEQVKLGRAFQKRINVRPNGI